MFSRFSFLLVALCLPLRLLSASEPPARVPVLVELFTSEGCSSCPPADALLAKLDRGQPLPNVELIVLSEHVDYWNHGGWADPFSSAQFSQRQQAYADRLNSEVYTPQAVIDGAAQTVGSDARGIEKAVDLAVVRPKAAVSVNATKRAQGLSVQVLVQPLPDSHPATVYLALATDRARSHVMRGENAGRYLEHVAVVESLTKIGAVRAGAGFQKEVVSALPDGKASGAQRIVVFVQDNASGQVMGVSEARLKM